MFVNLMQLASKKTFQCVGGNPRLAIPCFTSSSIRRCFSNATIHSQPLQERHEVPNVGKDVIPKSHRAQPVIRGLTESRRHFTLDNRTRASITATNERFETDDQTAAGAFDVELSVHGKAFQFSPVLLRDLCECPSCVDPSTKQKLFSTADIPPELRALTIEQTSSGISIVWDQEVPGYSRDHRTKLSSEVLSSLVSTGFTSRPFELGPQHLWDTEAFSKVQDMEYEAYMHDEFSLYQALRQLHTYGLIFLTNVPESEKAVSALAERIGPVKNTFYGYTWDVRSVPEAKNVAYTSQYLGFHMDLLYLQQPPHLQFLHCMRSSSQGGASLFTDIYKSATDLFNSDLGAWEVLSRIHVNYHYNHPSSHLYQQHRQVFEMKVPSDSDDWNILRTIEFMTAIADDPKQHRSQNSNPLTIMDFVNSVAWAPPFQGPFSNRDVPLPDELKASEYSPSARLSRNLHSWHREARKLNSLIHRPEGIYERLMKPGECAIFDNRRVLHARGAFETGGRHQREMAQRRVRG